MSISQVLAELETEKGDIPKLMQKYGEQLQAILQRHGGNISDLPMNAEEGYAKIQDKIRILGSIAQSQVKRLEPDELEKKRAESKRK